MFHKNKSRTSGLSCALLCVALFTPLLIPAAKLRPHSGAAENSFAENLDGKLLDPLADSEGRVVVLLFVRTDCPIANRYAPLLQKLGEKFRAKANFWLVYPDRAETASQIKVHLQDYH